MRMLSPLFPLLFVLILDHAVGGAIFRRRGQRAVHGRPRVKLTSPALRLKFFLRSPAVQVMWQALWPMRHCCSFLHDLLFLLPIFINAIASYGQWAAPQFQAFHQTRATVAVKQGDTAILECKVNPKFPDTYKVMWTFKTKTLFLTTQKLTSDHRIFSQHRESLPDVWDLAITQVNPSDEGNYLCIINTEPPQKRTVELIVKAPPRMLGKSLTQIETISEGQQLRVNCTAVGKPAPTMTWTREDSRRKIHRISNNPSDDIYAIGGSLVILRAKRWMEGAYHCTASNDVYPPARKGLTLTVHFKPVVEFVNSRIGQKLGGATMLQCKVEGNPLGKVHWEFNGRKLRPDPQPCDPAGIGLRICIDFLNHESGPTRRQVDLTIRNVTMVDYGDYACVATSRMGTTRAFANIYKIYPLGLEHRHRRLYQNDATKGYRTPSTMTDKQERVETLLQVSTAKPHVIITGRNQGPISPRNIPLSFISFLVVTALLHQLPC